MTSQSSHKHSNEVLVSVLMPLYNGAAYVQEAIESVLRQTYQNIELIVLNDGSTDESERIVLSFQDKRIRYEKNPQNLGIVKTRNKLFQLAKGEFWAILDCDDVAKQDRIAKQCAYLQQRPDYFFCGSWARKIDENGKRIGKMQPPIHFEDICINQFFQSSFVQSSVMFRAAAYDYFYAEEFPVAEDYDLWERLLKEGKAGNLPEYLVDYRSYFTNTSQTKVQLMQEKRNEIIERQLQLFADFTQDEIALISGIGALEFMPQKNLCPRAIKILRKLRHAGKQNELNISSLEGVIAYRWIFYCVVMKRYCGLLCIINYISRISSIGILFRLLYAKALK